LVNQLHFDGIVNLVEIAYLTASIIRCPSFRIEDTVEENKPGSCEIIVTNIIMVIKPDDA
jgi:hypothetical protein